MGMLDGKTAVITGAGRGIGRGLALHLDREGAGGVVNDPGGSVDGEGADKSVAELVAKEIRARGGRAVANTDSVATWEGGQAIIQTATDHFGRVDILINNAGILRDEFLYQMSEEQWDAVISVHLKGSCYCTRAAIPYMLKNKWGRILFMTSTAGFIGTIKQCNYGAAKVGMLGLSRTIAMEFKDHNITSNCIAPFAWTRIPDSIPAEHEAVRRNIDRLFKNMTPEDISPLAVYLASEQARAVTGQVFGVRGKEIYIFNQPRITRSIHCTGGWTVDKLNQLLESTFKPHLTPLDNSMTYFTWEALI